MTELNQIITPERTRLGAQASSKKKSLELVSEIMAETVPELNSKELFNRLTERERLGSTGFGQGVALPHCRLPECQSPTAVLLRLAEAVDYDATDQKPVDLICALVVPEEANQEHLQLLSTIAGRFSDETLLQKMRETESASELHALFTGGAG